MLKIILSSPAFFPHSFGGGEMYVYRLARELQRRNHRVTVLIQSQWVGGNNSSATTSYTYEGIPVLSFSINPEAATPVEREAGFGPSISFILRGLLDEIKPDIVHINALKPALTSLCNDLKIPHVVTAHHAGIACPAGALVRPDGTICNKPINLQECMLCCNASRRPRWHAGSMLGRLPRFIYRPLGKKLNKSRELSYLGRGLVYPWIVAQAIEGKKLVIEQAEQIIAPSGTMKDLLIRNGRDPQRIVVVPHGIEPLNAPLAEHITDDIKERPVRFGYVGRIDPSKGLHILLEAAEQLTDGSACEIHVYGAARNPLHEEYRKKTFIGYKGKASVFDHGLIPQNRLGEVFTGFDVLVVPSHLPEAFGFVVPEAFSAGRPVIVFNSGALPELVRNGIDGFIVEKNDSASLTEVMQRMISDREMVLRMSKRILPVFTVKEHVDEIEKIYLDLLIKNKQLKIQDSRFKVDARCKIQDARF